ncbi:MULTISPECIES: transporter substrate-binding domain-containing protein [unclassified Legionella]|uniref:transporter substrate-binding domain-containing protein n=1 Tax=unclassified Legionella TaxID=2622702 RepID=UPI0010552484|nr:MULTISPECIES: transporter substrate-binding domain-containing protein [unclassified Legionella]MDI9818168.1 transporter substrate-binding domain-containing protein [Legionella sp. PL877]
MKILYFILCLFISCGSSHAQGEPLRVAVDSFMPPFVMEGANRQLFGFDISMMEHICRTLQRNCIFNPMPFKELLRAVELKTVDVAVSAITITSERATRVNFSLPYLLSQARFIAPDRLAREPFSLQLLHERSIGVEEATVFPAVIRALGIRNPRIREFSESTLMIDALQAGKIDLALMDNPSAMYWQAQSSGHLHAVGEPFAFGFGFGIAVHLNEIELLQDINRALIQYQNSEDYKREFHKYIAHF